MKITVYATLAAALLAVMLLCICIGSVNIAAGDTVSAIWTAVTGGEQTTMAANIIAFMGKTF